MGFNSGGLNPNYRHGMCRTREYSIWCNMMNRCYRVDDEYFHRYGGRGIYVAGEWHDFVIFNRDMGVCPNKMSLDRIDNDGPYCKSNCRWVDMKTQQRNKSNNSLFTYLGESKTIGEWSEEFGIKRSTLSMRVYVYGWPFDVALTTPVGRRNGG